MYKKNNIYNLHWPPHIYFCIYTYIDKLEHKHHISKINEYPEIYLKKLSFLFNNSASFGIKTLL